MDVSYNRSLIYVYSLILNCVCHEKIFYGTRYLRGMDL